MVMTNGEAIAASVSGAQAEGGMSVDEAVIESVARAICRAEGRCKYAGEKCNTGRCSVAPSTARAALAAIGSGASWDDPELDATDAAHPAWWRGNDAGVAIVVQKLTDALDGKDDGSGVHGYEPLENLRRRLIAIGSGAGRDALLADAERALQAMMSMKPHRWLCECSACVRAHETHEALVRALASPEKAGPTPPADKCAECGYSRKEHSYNGACYGLCGEFVAATPPAGSDLRERATAWTKENAACEDHEACSFPECSCGAAWIPVLTKFSAAIRAEAIATLDREQPTPAIFELQDRVSELEEALQIVNSACAEAESAPTWDDAVRAVREGTTEQGVADWLASVKPQRVRRRITLYRDDSTVQVVYDEVKAVFWTAGNTVLVISQYTDAKSGAHRYIHWPRERFCWFKDDPHVEPQREG